MNWLKAAMILPGVALWLAATHHCLLEQISGLPFLVCGDQDSAASHQETDCESDGCAVVETGFYKSEEVQVTIAPVLLASDLSPPVRLVKIVTSPLSTIAPADLVNTWQFTSRAALLPRAPSRAS